MGQLRDTQLDARERELIARIRGDHDDLDAVLALRAHYEAKLLERIAIWLDDQYVTPLEDDEPEVAAARERYEHTQLIWCPRPA